MLTESERKWLAGRKPGDWCAYIDCSAWCDRKEGRSQTPYCFNQSCYLDHPSLYRDAAEFSERVAAKLARMMLEPNRYPCRGGSPQLGCMRDWSNLTGPMAVHCEDCILREVRLQVEEEMDNDP